MKRRSSSVVTGVLMVGAMLVALASPAWAPRAWGIPNLIAPCGTDMTFVGSLYLNDFDYKAPNVIAGGSVAGACRPTGDTSETGHIETTFSVPVKIASASCDVISLSLGDLVVRDDVTIDMSGEAVLLDNPSNNKALRKQMCLVMGRWRGGFYDKQPSRLMTDLDRILLTLDGL